MAWSKRSQWFVVAVAVGLAVIIATAQVGLRRASGTGAHGGEHQQQWRAESDTLVERVEKLSTAGEVDAASSVLEVLLQRPDLAATGQGDRARMAVARAYLAGGRRDQALAQVQAIPWADKGAQIAAEIVGLELAVRWRGLFDDQQDLVSGAIPPRNSREATFGRPDGLWRDRWNQYRALATALDRGARMVAAEGGQVVMPATPALMQVARYSRGEGNLAALMKSIGAIPDADLALTLVRLHLSEHNLDAAFVAAEIVWTQHAQSTQAVAAFRELRLWQLRRQAMATRLDLWSYPLFDQRLEALAVIYPTIASSAATAFTHEREINQAAMEASLGTISTDAAKSEQPVIKEAVQIGSDSQDVELIIDPGVEQAWQLAHTYHGLSCQAQQREVAAGTPARFTISSEHRGEHRLRLHRLADRAAWDALYAKPSNGLLPTQAVAEVTLDLGEWSTLGTSEQRTIDVPDLAEGFYAATLSARGCPVVVLAGVTVVDPDLHLIAGRAEILGWVVRRASGQAKAGETISATLELVRNTERAAGAAWAAADPAWRSGFNEGFTGVVSTEFRRPDQQTVFTAGVTAGHTAALSDPQLRVTLTGITDANGLVRLALPERLRGRAYTVEVHIARPQVRVSRSASFGEDAAWTSKAVVWADKPLARPGETVRFKVLLRDFNGDGYRLPIGELDVHLLLGESELSRQKIPLSDHGTVTGEVVIPPGAEDGSLRLVLGEGAPRHLARVERVRLPPVRYEFSGLADGLQVRAGETVPLTFRLRDRGGEPLAGIVVHCAVSAQADGVQVPCEAVPDKRTDLAGEIQFTVPTLAKREADYQAIISFDYEGVTYRTDHDWRTRTFPFQLDTVVRNRDLRVGGVVQVELRLPVDAEVTVQFTQQGRACGAPITARGRWPAWTQVAVALTDAHLGADAVTVSTAVLGGETATRTLVVSVQARQASDGAAQVALMPVRSRVETGERLALALGTSDPGRDLLVLGGARDLLVAQVERLDQSAKQADLEVSSTWAPNLFLSAVAYLPGQGFVTSPRREVEVLPVDRLLKVSVLADRVDYRPGDQVQAEVQVVDWRGQPVAGCSLSLGVVNELLYQLAEDPTPDLWQYFHTYHREWGLVDGRADQLHFPQALFWRSVISRWQPTGAFMAIGAHSSSAGKYGVRRGGGGKRQALFGPLLQPEADSTIHWVADVRTDAQGKATVRFPLPPNAGRFRCTARANDASAAVVVGEIRSVIASRELYSCAIDLPDVVAAGDVVPAQVQVANHDDKPQTLVLTLPDGATREVNLAPHARRTLTLPLTIPVAPSPAAEVVRVGEILGERLSFNLSLSTTVVGSRVVTASASALRRLPGLPSTRHLRVVADEAGEVHLPFAVQPGAGVWLRLRAWPDATTRRASALNEWRRRTDTDHPALAAVAWLLAEPGAERREQLAKWWPKLSDSAASVLVKQAAARRGEVSAGITKVPDDVIGDWLLARGRAAGQLLPPPRRRGITNALLTDRVAAAAIALAEGWSEGPSLWNTVQRELLADGEVQIDALALGIGCDAARLADDVASGKLLMALFGRAPWNDELVQVLAAEVIPAQAEVAVNQVRVRTGQTKEAEVVLPASEFAEWLGVVGDGFLLRTAPGALVEMDLVVQQPRTRYDDNKPLIGLWQDVGDGYEAVPVGQAISPGRRLLLVIDHTDGSGEHEVTVALPSLLQQSHVAGEVMLIDRRQEVWTVAEADVAVLSDELQRGDRPRILSSFTRTLQRLAPKRTPVGRRLPITEETRSGVARGGNLLQVWVASGDSVVLALDTLGEGACTWPGAQIDDGQRADQRLVVASGQPRVIAPPIVGHPLAAAVLARAAQCTDDELEWLFKNSGNWTTLDDWQSGLRILDPTAEQSLDELVAHPGVATAGHWTQRKIRRWVDGEPLLNGDADHLRGLIEFGEPTLESLVTLAEISREDRRQAWFSLPQPQAVPAVPLVNLRRWYDRLVKLGLITSTDYRAWCWQQNLDGDLLARLSYANTIDAWVAFIRQQLELPLHIGTGVRTGSAVGVWVTMPGQDHTGQMIRREAQPGPGFGGAGLGTSGLSDDLVVVTLPDGYELRPFLPLPQPRPALMSLDYTDVSAAEVLDHLNLLLANRGMNPLRLGSGITREQLGELPPFTWRIVDVDASQALDLFAKIIGLKLVRDRHGIVLEREQ